MCHSSGDKTAGPNQSQKNGSTSDNWKGFLSGLRTGNYESSESFRHHMDPDAPLLLPDDYGKSDDESQTPTEKTPKQPKKSRVLEAKEALNKGREHINAKGKLVRARRMGAGCASKGCRLV